MSTIDSFGIALPPDWTRFPLDDADFDGFVRTQRDRVREEASLSRTGERQLELMMRQLRNDATRTGTRLVAMVAATAAPDENGDGEHELVMASCTINVLDREELRAEIPLTVNTLLVAVTRERREADDGSTMSDLDPPAIVEMPCGSAVKTVRLHTYKVSVEEGGRLPIFVQHFLMPIDAGERAVIVTFGTPTIAHSRGLSRLFDEMMATFRVFSDDDDLTDPQAAVPTP